MSWKSATALRASGAAQGGRRRSSGLASLDLLFPELLLDERGQTLATGVSVWENQGTAGGNATQGTAANQPSQTLINGQVALNFDGTNDALTTSLIASDYVTTTDYEGLVVVQVDTISGSVPQTPTAWYSDRSIFQCTSSASFGVVSTRFGVAVGKGSSPWDRSAFLPGYADGLPHVISFRRTGGIMTASLDGGPERSKAVTTTTPLTGAINIGVNFGGSAPFDGKIATLMLKKGILSPTDRAAAISFVAEKYGIFTGRQRDLTWIGDSITATAGGAQWRQRVQTVLGTNSTYRTVGAFRGTGAPFPQDMVSAAGGYTISSVNSMITSAGFGNYMVADVVPILIGTNDLGNGADVATLRTRYLTMLNNLKVALPNALLIAQKILPRTDIQEAADKVADWNANYHEAMVADAVLAGCNVISDDTLATLPGIVLSDGLHPATESGGIMGDALAPRALAWIGMVP